MAVRWSGDPMSKLGGSGSTAAPLEGELGQLVQPPTAPPLESTICSQPLRERERERERERHCPKAARSSARAAAAAVSAASTGIVGPQAGGGRRALAAGAGGGRWQ